MDFPSALRSRLLASPGLAPLADVYFGTAPPGASFPFLVISGLYEMPMINITSSYYLEEAYQFSVLSQDGDQADILGESAHDALLPIPENPPIVFDEGYEMSRFPGPTRGPDPQDEGMPGGDRVWIFSFDYTFLVGKG